MQEETEYLGFVQVVQEYVQILNYRILEKPMEQNICWGETFEMVVRRYSIQMLLLLLPRQEHILDLAFLPSDERFLRSKLDWNV